MTYKYPIATKVLYYSNSIRKYKYTKKTTIGKRSANYQ